MQKFCSLLLAGLLSIPAIASNQRDQLLAVADRLADIGCYADSCTYDILLASMAEPVIYSVRLESAHTVPGDSLAPCNYVISWTLPGPSGVTEGFSAYFDGSHYRFRDHRLQEYHAEWDPVPFAPSGKISSGVQCQAQFADLLPQFIARRFREMADDEAHSYTVTADTVVSGRHCTVVKGRARYNGYDASEYDYVFDAATLAPRKIQFENNPGQIGEQSISITYGDAVLDPACRIDYETLSEAKATAFENYRESSFSLEKLPGRPLPRITAPTTTGERYLHERGDGFVAPTVFVFLDADIGSTPDVISEVRQAVAVLPRQTDVVWAFVNHRLEDIENVMIRPEIGEHMLMNARSAAAECGVGDFTPALVFVGTDGKVTDYIKGFNKDLGSLVIQKASLSN